jgi:hypothetical protein
MSIATRLDMKRDLKPLYAPPTYPVLVEVPPLTYLMIDGVIPEGSTRARDRSRPPGGDRRTLRRDLHPEVRIEGLRQGLRRDAPRGAVLGRRDGRCVTFRSHPDAMDPDDRQDRCCPISRVCRSRFTLAVDRGFSSAITHSGGLTDRVLVPSTPISRL